MIPVNLYSVLFPYFSALFVFVWFRFKPKLLVIKINCVQTWSKGDNPVFSAFKTKTVMVTAQGKL